MVRELTLLAMAGTIRSVRGAILLLLLGRLGEILVAVSLSELCWSSYMIENWLVLLLLMHADTNCMPPVVQACDMVSHPLQWRGPSLLPCAGERGFCLTRLMLLCCCIFLVKRRGLGGCSCMGVTHTCSSWCRCRVHAEMALSEVNLSGRLQCMYIYEETWRQLGSVGPTSSVLPRALCRPLKFLPARATVL
jgi:hypothetical protein